MSFITDRILPVLQLSRIALVFTAISNIWVMVILADAFGGSMEHGLSLTGMLAVTMGVAGGLYVFGMVLNDILGARHDKTFAPKRPLPSGRVSMSLAVSLAGTAGLLALGASVGLGGHSVFLCFVCLALIILYDGFGKFVPAMGLLLLGLIRATNMMIAAPSFSFWWPIWLTLTHVIAVSAICHRLEDKRPRLSAAGIWVLVIAWVMMTLYVLGWMGRREGIFIEGKGWIGILPALAVIGYVWLTISIVKREGMTAKAGGLMMKWALLWLIVYDASWLMGAGLWEESVLMAGLFGLALGSMTLIRAMSRWHGQTQFQRELSG